MATWGMDRGERDVRERNAAFHDVGWRENGTTYWSYEALGDLQWGQIRRRELESGNACFQKGIDEGDRAVEFWISLHEFREMRVIFWKTRRNLFQLIADGNVDFVLLTIVHRKRRATIVLVSFLIKISKMLLVSINISATKQLLERNSKLKSKRDTY